MTTIWKNIYLEKFQPYVFINVISSSGRIALSPAFAPLELQGVLSFLAMYDMLVAMLESCKYRCLLIIGFQRDDDYEGREEKPRKGWHPMGPTHTACKF